MTIRVLIIDDSAMVRKVFTQELSKDPDIEVVGTAPDPYVGRDKIVYLKPDVVTLDVEMPRMDGLTFLGKLMKYYPLPVIIVSSLAKAGGDVALKAIELGAVEVLAKPGSAYSVGDMAEQLIQKIKAASRVKVEKRENGSLNNAVSNHSAIMSVNTTDKIVAIGASTGGTEALVSVLSALPVNCPPIAIVQHMPENFIESFAQRLNSLCKIDVRVAGNNELMACGKALLAPGNKHLEIYRNGAEYRTSVIDGPMMFHQRPAVEIMFNSVAKNVGKNAVGVIMTGMGKDGAQGLLNMKNSGAKTIAQDEKSCIVYGMPREAVELGAADKILSLKAIPQGILDFCK